MKDQAGYVIEIIYTKKMDSLYLLSPSKAYLAYLVPLFFSLKPSITLC